MKYNERKLLTRIAEVLCDKTHDTELRDIVDAMTKKSRIFVYGTLRAPEDEDMYVLDGYRLETVARANHKYPIIVKDPKHHVIGNIIEVLPRELDDNDTYESCGFLYDRIKITVKKENIEHLVWAYVPLSNNLLSDENKVIESGDWFNP